MYYLVPLLTVITPQNVTVNNGGSASFRFLVMGSYFINITWLSPAGSIIDPTSPDTSVITDIVHTNASSTISFTNIQRSQAEGWYSCICYAVNESEVVSVRSRAFLYVQGMHVCTFMYIYVCSYHLIHTYVLHAFYVYVYTHTYLIYVRIYSIHGCTYVRA